MWRAEDEAGWEALPREVAERIVSEHFKSVGKALQALELWLQRSSEGSIHPLHTKVRITE